MRLSEQKIKELLRWMSRQNREIQLEIFSAAFGQDAERIRIELARGTEAIQRKLYKDKRKADRDEIEDLRETHQLRIAALYKDNRGRRKSALERKVRYRLKLIERLRDEGLGWRKIAEYLAKYADLKISYQQLRRLYLKLTEGEE